MAITEWQIGLAFVVIGIMMLLAEASAPGFFIAIPATVLIVLGLLAMAVPGFFFSVWSPIVALLTAVPATIITILVYRMIAPPEPPTTTVGHSLIGRHGIVTKEVVPNSIQGKVKIENQIWSATSDRTISEGMRVIVTESKGVHVFVVPAEKESS